MNTAACILSLKLLWHCWQGAPGQVTACESLSQLLLSPTLLGRNASLQGQEIDLTRGVRRLRHSWDPKAKADFPWQQPGLGTQSLCGGLMGSATKCRNRTRRKSWSRIHPLPGWVRGYLSRPRIASKSQLEGDFFLKVYFIYMNTLQLSLDTLSGT